MSDTKELDDRVFRYRGMKLWSLLSSIGIVAAVLLLQSSIGDDEVQDGIVVDEAAAAGFIVAESLLVLRAGLVAAMASRMA